MENILTIRNLKTYYRARQRTVPAVDGVDLDLAPGQMLGIVGESGCGKSTVARSIIGLIDRSYTDIVSGSVLFQGRDLLRLSPKEMDEIRGAKISMIFQNPLTSLNPVYKVGEQIAEVLKVHTCMTASERKARVIELLGRVGIPDPDSRAEEYPHELSGGMQQRVIIASALACNPEIIIADEPTTALDVTIQAQILSLIRSLNLAYGTAMILITHNMGIVAQMCSRIMVMYGGVVVEEGNVHQIFHGAVHPYTRGLLKAIPSIADDKEELYTIKGTVPRFSAPVVGCRFCDRCPYAEDICRREEPDIVRLDDGRKVRCHVFPGEGRDE